MGSNFLDSLNDVQKKRLYNAVLVVVVLLGVFLAVKSLNALKEASYIGKGVYPSNVISVTGTGEVLTVPDIASFSFSVVEQGKTVKEAQDKATKKINSIIDAVKGMDVAEKDIKTIGYNSYPKYEYTNSYCTNGYCPPSRENLVGYEVSQSIEVKVRKTDTAGDVLTAVGGLGAGNISGLNFVVDDLEKAKAEARDLAVADAKEKAKVLAKSLGIKLDSIVNFYESGDYPPIIYGMGGEMKAQSVSMDAANFAPQVPTGENKIISNVTITYEVK
jgi:uncharacterized protein YggE